MLVAAVNTFPSSAVDEKSCFYAVSTKEEGEGQNVPRVLKSNKNTSTQIFLF